MPSDRGPFLPSPFVARAARWGLLAWSAIGVLILVALLFRYVLYPIRIVFPPLVVALVVVYLLDPVITALEGRGVGRVLGSLVVYVVFLSLTAAILLNVVPVLTHQAGQFEKGVPALLARAQQGIDDFAARLGLHLNLDSLVQALQPGSGRASLFLGRITSFTSGVVKAAFVLVLGPLIAFYVLVDLPKIRRGAQSLVPARRREEVGGITRRVGDTLGGFFRGQLVVAILVGLFATLGFWFVGLPYFGLIGFLTVLAALVPLIGTAIAAIPTEFVALTAGAETGGVLHVRGGWPLALACLAVLVAAQELDTRMLSRRLLRPAVRMHPITTVLSLLLGGSLLGVWGMLLAVPAVAAGKVVLLHVWDTRATWPPPRPAESPETGPPQGEPSEADLPKAPRDGNGASGAEEGQSRVREPEAV